MIEKLKELTNIEILETDNLGAKVKFLDFIGDDEFFVRNGDEYIVKAVELAKEYKIKTAEGLLSLRHDIREVINHFIELGEDYIQFNLEQNNYDKDPDCKNRLSIYELEELERAMEKRPEIRSYKPYYLFSYNKRRIDSTNVDEVIDEMIKEKIIKVKNF